MPTQPAVLVVCTIALLCVAALWDITQRRVPNLLVFPAALLGVALQLAFWGWQGGFVAVGGMGVGLALLLPVYLLGTTGAGDVKLMAAVGTFLGPQDAALAALASIAVGSVVALGYAASSLFQRESVTPWRRWGLMCRTLVTTLRPIYLPPAEGEVMGRKFPFAVSIALGTTLFLAWPLIQARLPV